MPRTRSLDQPAFTWMRDLLWPVTGSENRVAEYAVLSRGDRPRLVLPLGARRATAAGLVRSSSDESRGRRMLRRALAGAARGGVLQPFLRNRFSSTTDDGVSIETYLAGILDLDRVELAVTIGPPRPNRKPVVQVMTPSGSTVAYAKIGWNGLTRRLVHQEAEVLSSVDRSQLTRLLLPTVIRIGEFRGLDVLVLSALEPAPGEQVQARDPSLAELAELRSLRRERRGPLHEDPYWDRLLERAATIGGASGAELADHARLVAAMLDGTAVVFAGGHGDWTPWNMVATDRHLRVWDWERAIDAVPYPLDVIHYHTQRTWFRSDASLHDAAFGDGANAARHALDAVGIPGDAAAAITRLYLIDLAFRYTENAMAGTDELLSRQHDEVLRVLRSVRDDGSA